MSTQSPAPDASIETAIALQAPEQLRITDGQIEQQLAHRPGTQRMQIPHETPETWRGPALHRSVLAAAVVNNMRADLVAYVITRCGPECLILIGLEVRQGTDGPAERDGDSVDYVC